MMCADGVDADVEPGGDLLVLLPLAQGDEHLMLALGQRLDFGRRPVLAEVLDDFARDRAGHRRAARGDVADRGTARRPAPA